MPPSVLAVQRYSHHFADIKRELLFVTCFESPERYCFDSLHLLRSSTKRPLHFFSVFEKSQILQEAEAETNMQ
jgi:hypothetical protein